MGRKNNIGLISNIDVSKKTKEADMKLKKYVKENEINVFKASESVKDFIVKNLIKDNTIH